MLTNDQLLQSLSTLLQQRGRSVDVVEDYLRDSASGYIFRPQLVETRPLADRGVHTVTAVEVYHSRVMSEPIFEYQHAAGDASIASGFEQWADLDLPPLLDALRPKAEACLTLELTSPATEGKPAYGRRVVLGPVGQYPSAPAPEPTNAGLAFDASNTDGEHPFCACCLFTRSFLAFKTLIDDDAFFGIRLYAARDLEGNPQADCRVNGHDFEPGAAALREYVKTWPGAGFEFRKQYVVLHCLPLPG
ncbi:MAG TPA: DUF6348 family protein [Pirellulales bacterium]